MELRKRLRQTIEDNSSRDGKIFDYSIQFLIFLSLVAFSIETLPNNSEQTKSILSGFEYFSIIIFSLEYLLRIFVSKAPIKYVFSFYGLIDLISILPFFLGAAYDLRAIRIFRVFRVFRALKFARYSQAINRFHLAAKIVHEEVILFLMVTMIFIFIASTGIYYSENEAQPDVFSSVIDSLWWAVVTLTTVGYGDVYPITIGGKVFTFFMLIVGVGIVTVPAGLVSSALSQAREIEALQDD
jgi:voltage-gated potassium channel